MDCSGVSTSSYCSIKCCSILKTVTMFSLDALLLSLPASVHFLLSFSFCSAPRKSVKINSSVENRRLYLSMAKLVKKKKLAARLPTLSPVTSCLLFVVNEYLDPRFDELSQEHVCSTSNQTSPRVDRHRSTFVGDTPQSSEDSLLHETNYALGLNRPQKFPEREKP